MAALPPIDFADTSPDPWSSSPDRDSADGRARRTASRRARNAQSGPEPSDNDGETGRATRPARPAKPKKRRRVLKALVCVLVALAVGGVAAFLVYCEDGHPASADAVAAAATSSGATSEGWLTFGDPSTAACGLVLYPGARVDADAYAPLLELLADRQVFCVLVEMPFNMAFFDIGAADDIPAQYPAIDRWYLAGHSLGGAMAASYLANHADAWDGLVLLAAYSTADLSQTDLSVLTLVGSEDGVVDWDRLDECAANLPADARTVVIEGGNHANFGSYGVQEGDGRATVSSGEQKAEAAQAIVELMGLTYSSDRDGAAVGTGAGDDPYAGIMAYLRGVGATDAA